MRFKVIYHKYTNIKTNKEFSIFIKYLTEEINQRIG